jgi:hypothetical protein
MSLRIDRVYCGNTIKDGHFGVARLRVAAAAADASVRAPEILQVVVDEPRLEGGCQREVVARALEGALADPLVAEVLAAPPAPADHAEPGVQAARWSRTAIRALFPGLERRIRDELDVGRALLAGGRVADANAAFARERARDEVTSRVAYAPDGSVLARYYFPRGEALPVVREDDTRQDGRPDRWVGYRGRVRRDIFEDGQGSGRPDLRLVFAPEGLSLERIEMDFDAEGQPGRALVFTDGSLVAEEHDTDGDGVIDRFDQLDAEGRVARRDEDLDGDGEIDVRSVYRRGELEQRNVSRPAL